jgi:hypothetical protein
MKTGMRLIARLVAITPLLGVLGWPAPQPAAHPGAADPDSAAARINPEVRLRKLHLVRPDLIPYPVAYEVYC